MDNVDEVLSSNVMRLRNALNLTQEELASAAELSLRMIQKIEYKQAWPSPKTIKQVAKALKVDPADLFLDGVERPSITVETLLDALSELQKEHTKLQTRAKGKGNVLDSEIIVLREKLSPETVTKLVRAKGIRLEVIKALIDDDSSNIRKLLEDMINAREQKEKGS